MDSKLIYEWLFPDLKQREWRETSDHYIDADITVKTAVAEDMFLSLPDLDWNTWFNHVLPKLIAEGCSYTVVDFHADESYYLCIMGPEGAPYIQVLAEQLTPERAYDALVQYLEWNEEDWWEEEP